jgi:voltage-gated potassium channel
MDPLMTVALAAAASNGLGSSYGDLKRSFREMVQSDPMDAALVTVLGGSYLFYVAEKDVNPKVKTYTDALVFISTCMSVGYSDIFARTEAGKAIASAVMTIGPKLSGAFFDAPASREQKPDPTMEKIATTLDAILLELRSKRS